MTKVKRKTIEFFVSIILGIIVTILAAFTNEKAFFTWVGGCVFGAGTFAQLIGLGDAIEEAKKN